MSTLKRLTKKLNSFIELGALYQLKPQEKKLPVCMVTNQYNQRAVLRSVDSATVMEKNIPLRKF